MAYLQTLAISLIFFFFFFFFFFVSTASAQSAAAPGPAGPTNITAVLEKAGQFSTLIRLLKSTQIANQINQQLNNSNSGLTIFAPTDNAFSSLPPGTLNSLTDQQKVALIQFHILPSQISIAQFQTVSNPIRTQAGDASNGRYPLNVTSTGNQVNISTGVVNTTIANTLYSDSQLAVYQVDQVLLPLDLFGPPAPAPAPELANLKKKKSLPADSPTSSPAVESIGTSATVKLSWSSSVSGFTVAAAAISLSWSF